MPIVTILVWFTIAGLDLWPQPAPAPAIVAVSLAAASIVGGNQVTGTVTLGAPAPAGGQTVALTTSSFALAGFTNAAGATASILTIVVPEQATSATFQVKAFGVAAPADVIIGAATHNANAGATLTVTPASVASVTIAPAVVVGGKSATGTVTLNGDAPAAGVTVPLSIAQITSPILPDPSGPAATVPATVSFGSSARLGTFTVTTTAVTRRQQLTITATFGQSASANFLVIEPSIGRLQIHPNSVFGSNATAGTVFLSGPAPAGVSVALAADGAAAVVPFLVPVSVGSDRVSFNVRTHSVTSPTAITIAAGFSPPIDPANPSQILEGATTAKLTVFPAPAIASVAATPSTLTGGFPFALTLTLAPVPAQNNLVQLGVAPPPTRAQIVVDRPDLVQLPAIVTFPANVQHVTVNGTTAGASTEQSVVITATVERSNASTSIVVRPPPPPIASFTLRPTTVTGGQSTSASITVTPTTVSPTGITLTSDRPDLVQMPSSVTVNPGAVQSFTIQTSTVTAQTTVTITATAGTQVVTARLTITP
jgi:hypothetical protein